MGNGLRINERVHIPEGELVWRFSRAGGPGGQAVNTADSRVELLFDALNSPSIPEHLRDRVRTRAKAASADGMLRVVAAVHRSQLQNREEARRRMTAILRAAVAPPAKKRQPTKPTRGSRERRLDHKRQRSALKRQRRPSDE